MPRRPGPPPDENHQRRNKDPFVDSSGWTEIVNEPYDGEIPPIPDWIQVSAQAKAAYEEIARLPQAASWGPGSWLELHMGLLTLDRYLGNVANGRGHGSSEAFKAIVSTLGSALRLSDDDLSRARMKLVTEKAEEDADAPKPANVTRMEDRRKRLG